MSARMPWSESTARACEIDALVRAIAPGCGFGRAARAAERPFSPGDEAAATAAITRVAELARAADADRLARLRAAVAAAPDPLTALARARAGDVLGDADFFDLIRFHDALARIAALCEGLPVSGPVADDRLAEALEPGRVTGGGFHLGDAFDHALAAARGRSASAQAAADAARSRLAERVAAAAGLDEVRDGEFVLLRDAVPEPPPGVRVLREAPAYRLCELLLDDAALAALAERDAAAERVAEAEEAVRGRLSETVAQAAPALERACAALGALDLLAARAAFAVRHPGVVPDLTDAGDVALVDARLAPLEERLAGRGRRYVPLSLELAGVGLVTGPNMGGKTAALRTLGFVAACCTLGVPVPARAARLPLFAEIAWLGLGFGATEGAGADGAADATLLSAFGAEVAALRAFLERPAERALVLVDEFARTTSPREGAALLASLLETLRDRGATGLATTHLAGVAAAAGVAHYAAGRLRDAAFAGGGPPLGLAAALDRIAAVMDYALERTAEDGPTESDALALAAALGLDDTLVARARGRIRGPARSA